MRNTSAGKLQRLPVFVLNIAWKSYLKKLQSDPLVTKALTSALLSVLSDIVAKQVSKLPVKSSAVIKELTIGLLLRRMEYSMCVCMEHSGPAVHFFHAFLDNTVFVGRDQTSVKVVAGKLILDQFLFAPAFTALYFYFNGLSEDQPLSHVSNSLRRNLFDIMRSNWSIWIPANFVSYYFVPLDLRVLFGNVIGVFWNAYLISAVSERRAIHVDANGSS